jgi:hypothetical protein
MFVEEYMKNAMLFSLMFVFILFGVRVSANEAAPFAGQIIDGKFYVEPGTVHVGPCSIFLELDGNYVPVEAVYIDEYGVYVNLRPDPDCGHALYCNRCGGCNPKNTCRNRCKCKW